MEDNNVMRRGRGRPKKNESFDRTFTFLGNEEHEYMRDALADELDKSGSEVLREALEMMYKIEVEWR